MDTGQTELLLENAKKLGIDLNQVDTVVLSHGHYDHGGGILPFAKINSTAKIYVPKAAFGEYYAVNKDGEPHYIGLAKEIQELPQAVIVSAEEEPFRIDDELLLFSGIGSEHTIPSTNQRLKKKTEDGFVQDDFVHEQCLVIKEGVKKVLLSGCAHHGILNIMDRYCELFGEEPDYVISGFHMMKKHSYSDEDINMIIDTALALRQYKTVFYTGHCTGVEPYNAMKKLMGNQLHYVHCGDEIRIRTGIERIVWNPREKAGVLNGDRRAAGAAKAGPAENTGAIKTNPAQNAAPAKNAGPVKTEPIKKTKTAKSAQKKRSEYMKWQKFFAWGTVACFVMTMVTGYKRK
jgi:7,8-dihydropterin-6-yl-methyl-4-(beta-D-ribofuranosyl)aminobenzene 5'-phosphate synthase